MAIRDFLNYLVYVEHAAENLQFCLWFKSYEKRFAEAASSEVALAPEWTQAMEDEAVARVRKEQVDKTRPEPATTAAIFKGTDFEKQAGDRRGNPFNTPPTSANAVSEHESLAASWEALTVSGNSNTHTSAASSQTQAAEAFQSAGARLPCKSLERATCPRLKKKYFADYHLCSFHPAFPSRDQPHNNELPHRGRSAAAQPGCVGAKGNCPCARLYHASVSLPNSLQER